MHEGSAQGWIKLLFGGLGVAAFSFAAPILWEQLSHRSAGPDHVAAALRIDDGVLLLLVRNGSDEPVDLIEAEIEIKDVGGGDEFAAYPEPSQIYEVDFASDSEIRQVGGRLVVKLKIAQAIDPGQVDQFGFRINGPAGLLTPPAGSLTGKITDIEGNEYPLTY